MGFTPLCISMLRHYAALAGGLKGCQMMELGSQEAMFHNHPDLPPGSAAKTWLELQGVKHTSVDLNGEHGSIQVDLSQPCLDEKWLNHFDIVTDFGTSEHVGPALTALYQCRANCHRWCRPGGLLMFNLPITGHWAGHGYHYINLEHFVALAALCDYGFIRLMEHPSVGEPKNCWQVFAVIQKRNDVPFIDEEAFKTVCATTVFTA